MVGPDRYRERLKLDPNITCLALQMKNAYQARSMYVGIAYKQIWAPMI